jgi:D-alanyl-D-alanine-carboxypeptidase/D-alanyl-D-alanine-endopeptidase
MRLHYLCCLFGLVSSFSNFCQAQNTLIQRLGSDFVQSPQAAGLSIGVLNLGKAEFYNFGTTDKEANRRPSSATLYEIGSNTKTFVSTLLAHAVLEGKLKLEDDIRPYLPGQYPNLTYGGEAIRVLHLANLTSGLPNWLPDTPELFQQTNPDSIPYLLLKQHRGYTKTDFYKDLHSVRLTAKPGSMPRHSNVAAQLLGFILETVYEQRLEALTARYITSPLGMTQTAYLMKPGTAMAKGYDAKGNPMPYMMLPDTRGSSGLCSTTADLIRYMSLQLGETNKAVGLTHQTMVTTPDDAIGLNWHIDKTAAGERQLWHTGGTFGFSSYLVLYPERQLGIVMLANQSDSLTQNRLVVVAKQIAAYLEQVKN